MKSDSGGSLVLSFTIHRAMVQPPLLPADDGIAGIMELHRIELLDLRKSLGLETPACLNVNERSPEACSDPGGAPDDGAEHVGFFLAPLEVPGSPSASRGRAAEGTAAMSSVTVTAGPAVETRSGRSGPCANQMGPAAVDARHGAAAHSRPASGRRCAAPSTSVPVCAPGSRRSRGPRAAVLANRRRMAADSEATSRALEASVLKECGLEMSQDPAAPDRVILRPTSAEPTKRDARSQRRGSRRLNVGLPAHGEGLESPVPGSRAESFLAKRTKSYVAPKVDTEDERHVPEGVRLSTSALTQASTCVAFSDLSDISDRGSGSDCHRSHDAAYVAVLDGGVGACARSSLRESSWSTGDAGRRRSQLQSSSSVHTHGRGGAFYPSCAEIPAEPCPAEKFAGPPEPADFRGGSSWPHSGESSQPASTASSQARSAAAVRREVYLRKPRMPRPSSAPSG